MIQLNDMMADFGSKAEPDCCCDGTEVVATSAVVEPSSLLSSKPKRRLTAYNIFFQHERRRLLKSLGSFTTEKGHGKIGFADLARTISTKWRTLSEEERQVYNLLSSQDKTRHEQQMAVWKRLVKDQLAQQKRHQHQQQQQQKEQDIAGEMATAKATPVESSQEKTQGAAAVQQKEQQEQKNAAGERTMAKPDESSEPSQEKALGADVVSASMKLKLKPMLLSSSSKLCSSPLSSSRGGVVSQEIKNVSEYSMETSEAEQPASQRPLDVSMKRQESFFQFQSHNSADVALGETISSFPSLEDAAAPVPSTKCNRSTYSYAKILLQLDNILDQDDDKAASPSITSEEDMLYASRDNGTNEGLFPTPIGSVTVVVPPFDGKICKSSSCFSYDTLYSQLGPQGTQDLVSTFFCSLNRSNSGYLHHGNGFLTTTSQEDCNSDCASYFVVPHLDCSSNFVPHLLLPDAHASRFRY